MSASMHSPIANPNERMVVRSHGRVHFGLLEISESQPNCFGGIGLMIEQPVATVEAIVGKPSNAQCEILADSYWKSRIECVTEQWLRIHPDLPVQLIESVGAPVPHRGLGSGTQMASTIAALLIACHEYRTTGDWEKASAHTTRIPMEELSLLSQRGKRSNIGLCGFLHGGFVVDSGKPFPNDGETSQPLRTNRIDFPDWPLLIIQDCTAAGDSGKEESALFERCKNQSNPNRERMIRLVHEEILPAIQAVDWAQWNAAVGQYGRWAGEIFEPVQGGIYRSPTIANTIDAANALGLVGAAQSSWGPTVCAVAKDEEHANWCIARLSEALPNATITATKAANHPAQFSRS